ncbi:class I SAM-dependent methyltransferase [Allosalinactinospora lopnorensis]|uniref:class I SAM-dependent methyltransferase n=1 Tax=Allosalinactinospora lopnorensis TaxID=1352348 RepID=UPI000698E0DB|nr:class I SAM-dependent methyltransferase [Allosalinactinospora lopnorensis]
MSAKSVSSSPPTAANGANPSLYTYLTMRLRYTPQVIWWRHPCVWGVPNGLLHTLLAAHAGEEHVEVGVGNGYFPARLPSWSPLRTLHLLDVNPACMSLTARRLRGRFNLVEHAQNAVNPWDSIAEASVDSVGCFMTLHAIKRASMAELAPLVAQAHRVLKTGGRFIGCTIVCHGAGVHVTGRARRLIEHYNASGVFFNATDSVEKLRALLAEPFGATRVEVRVFGCVAVWVVTK